MAEFVFKNGFFLIDGKDISSQVESMTCQKNVEMQPRDAINSGTRNRVPSLLDWTGSINWFWANEALTTDSAADELLDQTLFNLIGSTETLVAMGNQANTTGNAVYFTKAISGTYTHGGSVGDIFKGSVDFMGEGEPLLRGVIALSGAFSSSEVAGDGYSQSNLGAVTSTQKVYAMLQILGSSGGTLDAAVVSSTDDGDFSGGTTRLSFTQVTSTNSPSAEFVSTAGAITDTAWRVELVISTSAANNYDVFCALAIE